MESREFTWILEGFLEIRKENDTPDFPKEHFAMNLEDPRWDPKLATTHLSKGVFWEVPGAHDYNAGHVVNRLAKCCLGTSQSVHPLCPMWCFS